MQLKYIKKYQVDLQKHLQLKFFFEELEITLLLFICPSFKCLWIKQAAIRTDLYNCTARSEVVNSI